MGNMNYEDPDLWIEDGIKPSIKTNNQNKTDKPAEDKKPVSFKEALPLPYSFMKDNEPGLLSTNKPDLRMLIASGVLILINFVTTLLMYLSVLPNNFIVFYTYPVSLVLLVLAFKPKFSISLTKLKDNRFILLSLLAVTVLFFLVHYYNYKSSPWNNYGLFDDAAWDIFDCRLKCFTDDKFEMIFFDSGIGVISRELVFHYYIAFMFRLFGYNLFVFNLALNILGLVTVIFTMLTAHEITGNRYYTIASGLTLMFLPLEFTQVHMGHRYAICGPLLMISFFFLVSAYKRASLIRATIGGIFAGLTMSSAIMGKQYIYGLIAGLIVYGIILFVKQRKMFKDYIYTAVAAAVGFIASSAPLWAYIFTHSKEYNIREANLMREFFTRLTTEGFVVVRENLNSLMEVLFAKYSGLRQFSSTCPVFTWYYCLFFVIGVILLIMRKRYLTVFLSLIPIAGCLVSLAYDFRILIAAPFICLTITEGVYSAASIAGKLLRDDDKKNEIIASFVAALMIMPNLKYLTDLAGNPESEYLLPHTSVAVSRYMQDLAIGSETPNIDMKPDEFNRGNTNDRYDLYICVQYTYAHIHAYLGTEYSREMLKLCGDFPYVSQSEEDIRNHVRDTIQGYTVTDKDLMLAFEMSDKVAPIVTQLIATGLATPITETINVDGQDLTITRLYIANQDIEWFKYLTATI